MKIKPKIYAQALADLATAKPRGEGGLSADQTAKNFVKLLDKNRDLGKIKEILAMAETIFAKRTGRRKIMVETARRMTAKQKELVQSVARKGDIISEKINKDLIAGIKIIIDNNQLDISIQNKLNNIFK